MTGQGLGAQVFSKQVENCIAHGMSDIRTYAARGVGVNGYYTWPRFGYDETLTKLALEKTAWWEQNQSYIEQNFPGAKSVLDIMITKEGRDWWKQNGTEMASARFDLSNGSRSRRVLEAYLAERAARGESA